MTSFTSIWRFILFLIFSISFPSLITATDESTTDPTIIPLTDSTFLGKIKSGIWIVEFFAPWCPHCKKFKPHYEKLAEELLPWRKSYSLFISNVDCDANEELCNKHQVNGYPTIYTFVNGERKDEFKYDQTYKEIHRYVNEMLVKFNSQSSVSPSVSDLPSNQPSKDDEVQLQGASPNNSGPESTRLSVLDTKQAEFIKAMQSRSIPDLGKYGQVVDLNLNNFDEITGHGGPWLLEFYAPWCGHCKNLEPIYEQLGRKLKGKMNIARINADQEEVLRKKFGIRGYPTIKLFKYGSVSEYQGSRDLAALEQFALQAVQPMEAKHVSYAEFTRLRPQHEVAIVFAYGQNAQLQDWLAFLEAADSWILPTVTGIYASTDPQFSPVNGEANVLVYRRGYSEVLRYPESSNMGAEHPGEETERKKETNEIINNVEKEAEKSKPKHAKQFSSTGVRAFVSSHRYPLLPELTDHNAEDIMDGGDDTTGKQNNNDSHQHRVIVLGIVDPSQAAITSQKQVLTQVADELYQKYQNQVRGIKVQAVWLNGQRWADYIERAYSLKLSDLPRVILAVPAQEEYFSTDEHGKPIAFTYDKILAAIDDVVQVNAHVDGYKGKLTPQSTRGRLMSWAKVGWRKVNTLSWGFLFGVISVSVLGIWFMCCRRNSSSSYERLASSKFD